MTRLEVARVLALVADLWPSSIELDADLWAQRLTAIDQAVALRAVEALSDEGSSRRPTIGQLRRRCFELEPRTGTAEPRIPADFAERQKIRDHACDLVDQAVAKGELIDPGRFPGYLGDAIRARLQQHWYWQNADAGRAINDPGDAEGRPTKTASRHWRLDDVRARQAVREADLQRVVGQLAGQQSPEEGA